MVVPWRWERGSTGNNRRAARRQSVRSPVLTVDEMTARGRFFLANDHEPAVFRGNLDRANTFFPAQKQADHWTCCRNGEGA